MASSCRSTSGRREGRDLLLASPPAEQKTHKASDDADDDDSHSDRERRPELITPARNDEESQGQQQGPHDGKDCARSTLGCVGVRHNAEASDSTVPPGDHSPAEVTRP